MNKKKITLGEYLLSRTEKSKDVDICIDGIECCAVCGACKFTEEGLKHFKDAMDMELDMDDMTVYGTKEDYEALEDYMDDLREDGGRLWLAWDLICGLAGLCSVKLFDEWFIE